MCRIDEGRTFVLRNYCLSDFIVASPQINLTISCFDLWGAISD